ncbi:hypothetical protein ACAW74_19160 [Fibrella sp. WM1]|uniref:hypothetical protein n=1 Tax=Fibrella musci TaxID=3242485 RepID=UPI00351F9501
MKSIKYCLYVLATVLIAACSSQLSSISPSTLVDTPVELSSQNGILIIKSRNDFNSLILKKSKSVDNPTTQLEESYNYVSLNTYQKNQFRKNTNFNTSINDPTSYFLNKDALIVISDTLYKFEDQFLYAAPIKEYKYLSKYIQDIKAVSQNNVSKTSEIHSFKINKTTFKNTRERGVTVIRSNVIEYLAGGGFSNRHYLEITYTLGEANGFSFLSISIDPYAYMLDCPNCIYHTSYHSGTVTANGYIDFVHYKWAPGGSSEIKYPLNISINESIPNIRTYMLITVSASSRERKWYTGNVVYTSTDAGNKSFYINDLIN